MQRLILYCVAILSFLLIVIFSSCISSEETNYMQHNIPIDTASYRLQQFEEYRLSVRDNIACKISTADEETRNMFNTVISSNVADSRGLGLVVYEDGTIIIPFFGSVEVIGLTIQEAEIKIQDVMRESIVDAQVKITLLNNMFYVYANDKQGEYRVYKENMTIYQALAVSGQTTGKMDLSRVKIIRRGADGHDIIKEFDLRTQEVVESQFYYIKPNDVIYFSTNKNAFFNVTSISAFVNMVLVPLTTLFVVSKYKF